MLKTKFQEISDYTVEITHDWDSKAVEASKEIVNGFAEICNGKESKRLWQSKYNEFVIYEYQPFVTQGFKEIVTFDFTDKEHKDYFMYNLHHTVKIMQELNELLDCKVDLKSRKAIRGTDYEREEFKLEV